MWFLNNDIRLVNTDFYMQKSMVCMIKKNDVNVQTKLFSEKLGTIVLKPKIINY